MPEETINYFKHAFFTSWNYVTLGVLGVMGIPLRFHPYFLLFAGLIELGTLLVISRNGRFRRAIRAKVLSQVQGAVSAEQDGSRLKKRLDEDHARRLAKYEEICRQIKANAEMADSPRSALLNVSLSKLDQMAGTYLQMLLAHQTYQTYLSQVDRDRIARRIESIDRDIAGREGKVVALQQKNRDILLQRLQRIDKARENIEVIEAELEVMESTIQLLRDQTISVTDPQGISQQIDTVLENMRDTETLVRDMDAFLSAENGAYPAGMGFPGEGEKEAV